MVQPNNSANIADLIAWLKYYWKDDAVVHAVPVLDWIHHEVHQGDYFSAGTLFGTLVAGTTYMRIHSYGTAIAKAAHFTMSIEGGARGRWELLENSTYPTGSLGIGLTSFNHYRTSAGTPSQIAVFGTSTPGTEGVVTPWNGVFGGSGPGLTQITSASSMRDEIILNNAYIYTVKIVCEEGQQLSFKASWYEEDA